MEEKVTNNQTEVYLNKDLLDIKIDGEEYKGLTPQEAARKFGTNYYVMQSLRFFFEGEEIEQTIQEAQSVKSEVIDIFIKTLEENNIFEGKLSIEEVRKILEQKVNAAYINNKGYRENIRGYWDSSSRNLYVLSKSALTPEQLKQTILNKDIQQLKDIDRLGTICHELLHSLSNKNEHNVGFRKDDKESGSIGRSINEGMTDFLKEKMVPSAYKAYKKEVDTTEYLLAIFGEDFMIDAYLNADFDAVLKMAEEKQASTEFMKLITLSDYRLNLEINNKDTKEVDIEKDKAIAELINAIGEIDVSKFVQYDISIPDGINEEILINACKKEILNNQETNKKYEKSLLMQEYPDIFIKSIDSINNGEINLEEYIKQGVIYRNEHIIAKHFEEEGKDFKELCTNVKDAIGIIKEKEGEDALTVVACLLTYGVHQGDDYSELSDFKAGIIEEITYGTEVSWENYTDTQSVEGYSWEEKISHIDSFEYYTTEEGKFLVDLENGEIMGKYMNSEIINMEELEFSQDSLEERSTRGIRYISEEKGTQIFFTEKNKEGKFVLKGYTIGENGQYVELDVGLGRDFLDDTTELDRQLASQTSEVRSGSIKTVAESIKSDIIKENETEKTTVEKEEENGER